MLQLTYELRPKWYNKKKKNKSQNAVSRSDPLQGSDKNVTIIMKQTWFADDNTKITILTKNKNHQRLC